MKSHIYGTGGTCLFCGAVNPNADALAALLKDGETPVQCIERHRRDIDILLSLLAKEKLKAEALPLPRHWGDETPKTPDGMELRERARALVASSPLHRRFIAHTPLENDIAVWIEDFASAVLAGRRSMFEPQEPR